MTTRDLAVTKTRCPRCGTDRCWLQWVAMTEWDTDSWTCVLGHNWAEDPPQRQIGGEQR